MKMEIKIPEVGESVREAVLAQWYKRDGDSVRRGEVLFLIETDKVTLEIAAEEDGVLHILVPEGETVAVGAVVGVLDAGESVLPGASPSVPSGTEKEMGRTSSPPATAVREPSTVGETTGPATASRTPAKVPAPELPQREPGTDNGGMEPQEDLAPSVHRLIAEKRLDASRIQGTGPAGRITRADVRLYEEESKDRAQAAGEGMDEGRLAAGEGAPASSSRRVSPEAGPAASKPPPTSGEAQVPGETAVTRKAMSRIRLRIAERLLEARQNTAMLTTFNEIDMSRVQELRAHFKETFRTRFGVSLGLMSFFVKAAVVALKEIPEVNAFIEGKEVVYHHYYHIGVAVGSERGLVVPVVRHADRLSFAEVERSIGGFVKKIKENRLELSDLEGGTFTISNGGVYGSLLSTPILNPPQTGILGMHKVEERPVAVNGQVVVRPMMYVALSYDHRLIDGGQAVTFLKRIKECIENPERIMMEI